jgi:hypothetical protein
MKEHVVHDLLMSLLICLCIQAFRNSICGVLYFLSVGELDFVDPSVQEWIWCAYHEGFHFHSSFSGSSFQFYVHHPMEAELAHCTFPDRSYSCLACVHDVQHHHHMLLTQG